MPFPRSQKTLWKPSASFSRPSLTWYFGTVVLATASDEITNRPDSRGHSRFSAMLCALGNSPPRYLRRYSCNCSVSRRLMPSRRAVPPGESFMSTTTQSRLIASAKSRPEVVDPAVFPLAPLLFRKA